MVPSTPPDPDRGVFETLLVDRGRPIELTAHLARMEASLKEIFNAELPASLREEARREADGIQRGRMRIEVAPGEGGGPLVTRIAASPIDPGFSFPPRESSDSLRSIVAPDWSGAHKWADREWLEQVEKELGSEVPLILDADEHVLEAGRANVFAVLDGGLVTPSIDARILPGTARAATIELAAELGIPVAERHLALAELGQAEDVILTSSVRGLRPVKRLNDVELDDSCELTPQLAAALRERWGLA